MNILVTGAAGYIGSIVSQELIKEGNTVIALDNLEQGHRDAVTPEALFVELDLADLDKLHRVFSEQKIDAVVHLAAKSLVGESDSKPMKYFHTNVICGIHLIDAMLKYDVNKLVFSSTAAIYGNPDRMPITENQPIVPPLNTYGESKLMLERLMSRYSKAYGLRFISLRYFNAAGASDRFGEDHNPETHLIANIMKVALGQCERLALYGMDYPTKDGTCIRDYLHVIDIAKAHSLALGHLEKCEINKAYNLGNGKGYSVLEVVETARKVTKTSIPIEVNPRRLGDPAALIASSELAKSELGWKTQYHELEPIIESAWRWQKEHPYGY